MHYAPHVTNLIVKMAPRLGNLDKLIWPHELVTPI